MATSPIKSCTVTVPTQKLKVIGEVAGFRPLVEIAGFAKTFPFPLMFSSVTQNMVKGKKHRIRLTTASTPMPVCIKNPFKQCYTPLCRTLLGIGRHLSGLTFCTALLTRSHARDCRSVLACTTFRLGGFSSFSFSAPPCGRKATMIWA